MSNTYQNINAKVLLVPGSRITPPARYRLIQYIEVFRSTNIKVDTWYLWPPREYKPKGNSISRYIKSILVFIVRTIAASYKAVTLRKYDYIIIQRDLMPYTRFDFIELAWFKFNKNIIMDFDDAIYVGARNRKMKNLLPRFKSIVVGNSLLYNFAIHYNKNVQIIPTVIDTDLFKPLEVKVENKTPVIGWIGSSGPRQLHLPMIYPVIERLKQKYAFEFFIISDSMPEVPESIHSVTKFVQWEADKEHLQILKFDIGLMPLPNNDFERGKCGFKAIQYMAVGIPALVSPVGANKDIVAHGVNGYHCIIEDEWVIYITQLINDKQKRMEMGYAGRLEVLEKYSLKKGFTLWQQLIK